MKWISKVIENIRNSITKKMLIITIIIFMAFLTFTLVSQKLLFENMYYSKKVTDIEQNVMRFSEDLYNYQTEEEIIKNIYKFKNDYNTIMAVIDIKNNVVITFKTELHSANEENDKIIQEFISIIRSDRKLMKDLLDGKQITISSNIKGKSNKYLFSAISVNGKIAVGFTSLQYINEAVGVINIFYKYFYIIAIIVIVLFSVIYSQMITNPLKKISKVATKMSNLSFDEKCDVKNYDEIGRLGYTLNFLSTNLENALNSLTKANEELQKDINKKEKIENMRKEFIADVSHELKTPITLIKGYAEGIKDDVFSAEEKEKSLDIIIEECEKMNTLVKDMLQISSLESGTIEIKKEEFLLNELIVNTIKKLNYSIEEKSITINLSLQEIKVVADMFKIEQVITNFLSNAIRHTNIGGRISIEIFKEDSGVKVSFENSGEKISQEDLIKIWDKFYKVDKGRKRKDGGTGLGLSIVKNILDIHGWNYGVENTEDGVKFYFSLEEL